MTFVFLAISIGVMAAVGLISARPKSSRSSEIKKSQYGNRKAQQL